MLQNCASRSAEEFLLHVGRGGGIFTCKNGVEEEDEGVEEGVEDEDGEVAWVVEEGVGEGEGEEDVGLMGLRSWRGIGEGERGGREVDIAALWITVRENGEYIGVGIGVVFVEKV